MASDQNPLDLVQRHLVPAAVMELDTGGTERVIADLRLDIRRCGRRPIMA